MVTKGSKKGTVRFATTPAGDVKRVMLAGDFNDWKPTSMRKQKNGSFVAIMPLVAGSYEYRFVYDEQWVTDRDNGTWAVNSFGTMNSVAHVA